MNLFLKKGQRWIITVPGCHSFILEVIDARLYKGKIVQKIFQHNNCMKDLSSKKDVYFDPLHFRSKYLEGQNASL